MSSSELFTHSSVSPALASPNGLTPAYEAITAVFWDFGGVILSSPFDAFARYEETQGIPKGTIRGLNATNPDTNAWAKFERSDVTFDEFCHLFETEARDAGHVVDARQVMALLHGEIRPEMVNALRQCKSAGLKIACLTNNVQTSQSHGSDGPAQDAETRHDVAEVMAMFDHVTESRHAGVRKPEVRFYELACEAVGVRPTEVVFLDDLGINLKPAAAMGMRTIKVTDPDRALAELEKHLGISLR
jgi:putative hydrolase of the HAD superfamily